MMKEIWKDIKGYEGLYQVSNLGRVKSCERKVLVREHNHRNFLVHERLLKSFSQVKGYVSVILCKDGKVRRKLVHRLVAEAFIQNPDNLPCINHKDEDKTNNRVDNLEWCTYAYNNAYNGRVEKCKDKISRTLTGRKRTTPVSAEARQHISEGAKRGWETRRKNGNDVITYRKGFKFMNNGVHEKHVYPEDIEKYLNEGYVFGRLKRHKEVN